MPYKLRQEYRHKFAKPRHKIINWPEYDKGLIKRGDLTIWFTEDAIKQWYQKSTKKKSKGRPTKYSNTAIEVGLYLKTVFSLTYRSLEGFLNSLIGLIGHNLDVPDHTCFSRRISKINSKIRANVTSGKPIEVIVDSTGLKICGPGEWLNSKHGTNNRKSWRKLHLAIDEDTQQIVATTLTTSTISDDAMVGPILAAIENPIYGIKADRAYDTPTVFAAIDKYASDSNPRIAIMPRPNAKRGSLFLLNLNTRQKCTNLWHLLGPHKWQKTTDYGKRSLVETAMMRYKNIIGDRMFSRNIANQRAEVTINCRVLNTMLAIAKPVSIKCKTG